jgi:hypothetical protein
MTTRQFAYALLIKNKYDYVFKITCSLGFTDSRICYEMVTQGMIDRSCKAYNDFGPAIPSLDCRSCPTARCRKVLSWPPNPPTVFPLAGFFPAFRSPQFLSLF